MIKLTTPTGDSVYVSRIDMMSKDGDLTIIRMGSDAIYVTETPEEILQPSEREKSLAWLVRLAYEEGHRSHSAAPDRSWDESWADSRARELLG